MANPVTKQRPNGTIYPSYFIQMQDSPVGRRSIAFVDAARQRRERLWRYGCLFCQTGGESGCCLDTASFEPNRARPSQADLAGN